MVKITEKTIYKTNKLFLKALRLIDGVRTDEEIAKDDITELFYDELMKIIENNELVNINVNGTVAKGKSTVAMALGQWILQNHYGREIQIEDIARTQIEASKMMRNPKLHDTVVVIDEWDTMEEGGENATAERGLMKQMSDVHAQRNNHKISCSPKEDTDANADIYIEIIQANKKAKKTLCYVYFKIFKGGIEHKQIIGYIEVDVNNVINKKFYEEYRKRKFEKMNLITEKGIFRPRTLDYSKIIWLTTQNLKKFAENGEIDRELIKFYIKKFAKDEKIPDTMLGRNEWVEDVIGLLTPYKQIHKQEKKIAMLKKQRLKESDNVILTLKIESCYNLIKQMKETIDEQTKHMIELIRIAKDYS